MTDRQQSNVPSQGADDPERRPVVIGTAGHVDHGKSTLVRALTGIDPDRLAEEKARAMTIDLGFAWLTLPSGRDISIVDVPGHERFIKNMLAGVGGIDAALLIVAADEGPMPQTAEHLAILDLLGIEHGVVVLTKSDAVDADWLDLVREETRERLEGITLAAAPIVAVSAVTGAGLPDLLAALDRVVAAIPARGGANRPRLPIDRVFTVAGFGAVVTGTLSGGELTIGQELRIEPAGLPTRVRGLQTHQTKVERALPGSRVAVNLANVAVKDLKRGDVAAAPNLLRPSRRLDAQLRLIAASPVTLEQNDEVDLFVGAAEFPARVTLLDRERLAPGETGWVQFRFREPAATLKGDRFIVRRPSPSDTVGGGEIVDPDPPRHRRFRPDVIGALATLAAGDPDDIVLQAIEAAPRSLRDLRAGDASGLSPEEVDAALAQLIAEGDAIVLAEPGATPRPSDFVVAATTWNELADRLRQTLAAYHAAQPLRPGMPREEAKSRLKWSAPRLFDEIVAAAAARGLVANDGATLRLPDFAIALDPARRAQADRFLAAISAQPFTPPAPVEFGLDAQATAALEALGEVVRVADNILYDPAAFERLVAETLALLDRDGALTLAGFRDHFGASRKYAQATLEYLDQRRITRRVGDERVRYAGPGAGRAPAGKETK
ncbi:MAG TPA: selenocysteine-specific translation elongation factor [Thermomicrobiales bacterium]|nr:selenocysteine-specific translation elongation factor [Thermomicrobiales bacterium]